MFWCMSFPDQSQSRSQGTRWCKCCDCQFRYMWGNDSKKKIMSATYYSTSVVVVYAVGPGTVTAPPQDPPGQLVTTTVEVV